MTKYAVIIGAGPAGLTAAYELLQKTDIKPIILEADDFIGGLSRTANYNGNKLDMGGHRFFSKSQQVMDWWQNLMPVQTCPSCDDILLQRPLPAEPGHTANIDPEQNDRVMLLRARLSRIYFLRRFFNYPLSLNLDTVVGLGAWRMLGIGTSYLRASALPIKPEKTLSDFIINRFGRRLYETFFRDYTEKVWGVPCDAIPADWGAQRIKDISISRVLRQAIKQFCGHSDKSINQKKTSASLIEQFIYPKFGPGHFWETVAAEIQRKGGEILLNHRVIRLAWDKSRITSVTAAGPQGECHFPANYCISTMPVRDLVQNLTPEAPARIKIIGNGLVYRDFRTVGLLVPRLKIANHTKRQTVNGLIPDTWIYIQDSSVKAGRLQIYNNWSPYLVKDWQNTVWLGVEYFCNEGDAIWKMEDKAIIELAAKELEQLGLIEAGSVQDGCSVKAPKAYPAYFGSYNEFDTLREYIDRFENLFLIGRNGMHRYNNMDHSMLTAMTAVNNIAAGISSKANIWEVNISDDYHEES